MSEQSNKVRVFFTELVDAVRYSDNWSGYVEKEAEAERSFERQSKELDQIVSKISALFEGLEVDEESLGSVPSAVNEFVVAATAQAKGRLERKRKTTLENLLAAADAERLKAMKNLESYLSVTPLPVLEEEITLALSDGSYSAEARYSCPEGIKYEFLLTTAESNLFRSRFTLATFKKGAKIPARLGKAWIKKEPVPDYEKLDGYFLSEAVASKNQITAKFVKTETASSINLVYSRSDRESFVTAEYSDKNGAVDVTGEPALSKHLDLTFLKDSMAKLLQEVSALDKSMLKLTKLEFEGTDVLATMNCFGLMQRVVSVMTQSKEILEAIRKLDPATVWESLRLLGPRGSAIATAVGLQVRTAKRT